MAKRLRILQETYDTVDALHNYLHGEGHRGCIGDMMLQWLEAQGATPSLPDSIPDDEGVAYSVSIGTGPVITGTELTAAVTGLEGGEVVSYQWTDDGTDITGATSSTYTPAIGTDSVADASDIGVVVTIDGTDYTVSAREIRYAAGTASSVADQTWTVDDTAISVDASASGTGLTFSYSASGLPAGVSINSSTGLITGTVAAVFTSTTVSLTATDQYGRTLEDSFNFTAGFRAAVVAANGLADQSFTEDTGDQTFATAGDFTLNGNTVTYSVNTVAGVSINSSTGVVTFDSDVMAVQSGTSIVVTATDEYGRTTTTGFSVAITATPVGPQVQWVETETRAGNTGDFDITFPEALQEGDVLVLFQGSDASSQADIPEGWPWRAVTNSGTSDPFGYAISTEVGADTSATTMTITTGPSALRINYILMCIRGADDETVVEGTWNINAGGASNTVPNSIVSTADNSLAILFASLDDDPNEVATYPSGWTVHQQSSVASSGNTIAVGYKTIPTSGTTISEPAGVDFTSSDSIGSVLLSFSPQPDAADLTLNSVGPQPSEGADVPIDYTIDADDTMEAVLFLATDANPDADDFNTGAVTGYIDLGPVSLTTAGSGINLTIPDGLDDNYKLAFLPSKGYTSDIVVSDSFAVDTDVSAGLTRTFVSKDATLDNDDSTSVTFSSQTLGTGRIVVFVSNRDGDEPTGVTIDGVTASLVTDGTTTATFDALSNNRVSAWSADSTSASGDIVITFGSAARWTAVNTYLIENFTAFDDVAVGGVNPSTAAPWSISLDNDTTASGIVLAMASTFNQAAGGTNFDNIVGVTEDTVAGTDAPTGTTIVASATGTSLETRTITIGDDTVAAVRNGGISIGIS